MVVIYDFDGDRYEYCIELGCAEIRKILKDYTKADLIYLIDELIDKEDIADCFEGEDILEFDKKELLDLIEDLVDYDVFAEYFEDELKDMFECRAVKEYEDDKAWEFEQRQAGFYW